MNAGCWALPATASIHGSDWSRSFNYEENCRLHVRYVAAVRTALLIIGATLTILTIGAVVHTMLIPSRRGPLIARAVNKSVTAVAYAPLASMRTYSRQNRWLRGVAPAAILIQLLIYVTILILALGLVVYGTTDLSMADSLYQSGSTLTTLGLVEPTNSWSAIATFFAAFLGLVVIALFIGYLLAIYGALVSRESPMARLSRLAGEPAWGPEILARAHVLGLPADEAPRCDEWTDWTCDVRLNQRVNPILADFRSPAELRHWVTTLLAVMDATALRIAFDPENVDPHAVRLLIEGGVTLSTLDVTSHGERNWDLLRQIQHAIHTPDASPAEASLSRDEWDSGIRALRQVDFPLPKDVDAAQRLFLAVRQTYADHAYAIARQSQAVPAPWSGSRSPALRTIWPETARSEVSP